MSEVFWISLVACGGAILTFFSGFGLGTILLPVFSFFFPLEAAIAMTAIVHLVNNLFKLLLTRRHIDWRIVARFGIPSLPFAALGAILLGNLGNLGTIGEWQWNGTAYNIHWMGCIIGVLMIVFALFDLLPALKNLRITPKLLPLGGALSGFFGGLTGHQGALRSAFLLKTGIGKEAFIATGVIIACAIDVIRITVYGSDTLNLSQIQASRLIWPCVAAVAGSIAGYYLLKKITLEFLHYSVGILLILVGLAVAFGLL